MAYKLYDRESSLTFPNGVVYTADELKENKDYKRLFTIIHVVNEMDGVVAELRPLYSLKHEFAVDIEDNQAALDECIKRMEERRKLEEQNMASLSEVAATQTDLLNAVGELGVMASESSNVSDEVLQAIGELGVEVSNLKKQIASLQTQQ